MKKKEKRELKDKEIIILRAIHKYGGFMSPKEISMKTGISYVTVLKYIKKLADEGILTLK